MFYRLIAVAFVSLTATAQAQTPTRTELKRADLTGTNMEIIVVVVDVPPGAVLPRHTHPGEEVVYVLDGATVAPSDGKEIPFPTGAALINTRDVPHAGIKIVGDKSLKMLNVFVVDKGKPMTVPAQ
ncbi:cupin domain-containing protein [Bradyrhizobium sp. BWA-3-5]|uniref:cupin domain-containing protein n=1 Tax=Bradyrhizobium sp. BWA-3-5 TaxID=3080013 RepID=UPI00293F2B5F|nr:cupin domain-containing protein [Bradyrhizobium sp. BWA-3-5]WOH67987.1 cupin domain-containing protein [Bradyrhizobium sp. BWA-3-5]